MHSLLIHIPGGLDPFDRGDRYEDPLDRALKKAGRLGECVGGGSGFRIGPGPSRDTTHIDVDVTDRAKAAPVIASVLKKAAAPAGTLVGDHESDELLVRVTASGPAVLVGPGHVFTPATPRLPFADHEVLGYRLTADRWAVVHVLGNEAKGIGLRVADWCGPALPPAADLPELVRRPAGRYALRKLYYLPGQRVGGFDVRLHRPALPAADRFAVTGVRAKPPRLTARTAGGVVYATPAYFGTALRQVFGLEPCDGATRLNHDLGLGLGHLHLAAWDAPGPVTAADAKALFYAHCGKEWKPTPDPLRGTVPATHRTRRFVAALKRQFRDRPEVWGWGRFRAAEGFVCIPVRGRDFAAVRDTAAVLGHECGVAVYDPQADDLVRPPALTALGRPRWT